MATVAGIAQEMALEFGEQYGDLDIKDQFDKWVKEVYHEIAITSRIAAKNAEHDIATVASTATYTLPATVSEPRDVWIKSAAASPAAQGKLPYTPVERLTARGEDLTEEGQPQAWYLYGMDASTTAYIIRLWPIPDRVYNLVVFSTERPTELASTDAIPLPSDYLTVLRDGVRARVKFNDNDLQGYAAIVEKYRGLLEALNSRFSGPSRTASRLGVKRLRGEHQAGAAVDGS